MPGRSENGNITTTILYPSHFDLKTHLLNTVASASSETNTQVLIDMLNPTSPSLPTPSPTPTPDSGVKSKPQALLDFVLLNASALLLVAGLAPDYPCGVRMARESIESGRA
jgi:anthranilate phosphoribosyltransferase